MRRASCTLALLLCLIPVANAAEPSPRDASAPAWPPPPLVVEEPASPTLDDFAGAKECGACHEDQYRAWSTSTHGKAGGVPGDVEIIAPFDGKPLRFEDAVVVPTVTADGRYVFRVRAEGRPRQEIEVAAVVGGGHMLGGGTQTFFMKHPDGSLRMLPFDFIRKENVWFAQKKDGHWEPISEQLSLTDLEHWPPHRAIGHAPGLANCESCHGSQIVVRFDPRERRYETSFASLKIDCESCHGPGREHIAWARLPESQRDAEPKIAPLVGLDKDASLRVCFQCHANKAVLDQGWVTGKDFEQHYSLRLPMLSEQPFLRDGRVNGFGYQENHLFSDCYVSGSMVCTDCHDPHTQTYRDVFGKPLSGRFDDGQCTGCHASKALDVEAHTHHPVASEGSRCTSCHMPYLQHQFVGDRLRFARSDHSISIPRPAYDAALGIEGACRQCHADRSIEWLEAKTEEWWGPIKPHPRMITSLAGAERISDRAAAAEILLVPGDPHGMAQFMGLATFMRTYLSPDMRDLEPSVRTRLEALARSPDLDVAAAALASLHVAAGNDPETRAFLAAALAERKPREVALRRRWARALADLARQWEKAGRPDQAELARTRVREIKPPLVK